MVCPALIWMFFINIVPMFGIIMAFQDFNPGKGILRSEFVGLENFRYMFEMKDVLQIFVNTIVIAVFKLILNVAVPVAFALLLNEIKNVYFKRTVQTIVYLPHFISWVVLASIVMEVLSPSRGVVNYVLQLFGMDPIFFVGSKEWFRPVIIGSAMWRDTGWQTVVFLAAITGIDPQLYEAAEVDGASRFQRILHITLPGIAPTIVIMFIFAVGGIIADDFDQIYNLLNAQVMEVGDVIGTYTYRVGLQQMDYSYATAVGLFRNVVSLCLVTFTNALSRKLSGSSLW